MVPAKRRFTTLARGFIARADPSASPSRFWPADPVLAVMGGTVNTTGRRPRELFLEMRSFPAAACRIVS
jgi:hypothetical protein